MTHVNQISRRSLLAATALTCLGGLPALAQTPDLSKLLEAPASGEHPLGDANAKVTIVEYASASCPHCANFYKDVFPALKREYIDTGKVRFLLRRIPHNDAGLAAFMLARCAPADKYHALIDVLFTTQEKWLASPLEGLKNIATQAGFTAETFDACLKNEAVAKGVLAERDRGNGFGVTGIPYIFINSTVYEGDRTFDAMKAVIDPLLT